MCVEDESESCGDQNTIVTFPIPPLTPKFVTGGTGDVTIVFCCVLASQPALSSSTCTCSLVRTHILSPVIKNGPYPGKLAKLCYRRNRRFCYCVLSPTTFTLVFYTHMRYFVHSCIHSLPVRWSANWNMKSPQFPFYFALHTFDFCLILRR